MLKVSFTNAFSKSVKTLKKRGYDISLLIDIIGKLVNDIPLDKKHHNHQLKGKYFGFYECHVRPDWLLIYTYEFNTLILVDTGTHSDLF